MLQYMNVYSCHSNTGRILAVCTLSSVRCIVMYDIVVSRGFDYRARTLLALMVFEYWLDGS